MIKEIIKKRVGKTPLVRAYNLEKKLGISKIYLKLEGNNPSGHREDRLAHLIMRDAISRDKKTICLSTYGTLGGSLSYMADYYRLKCIFYIPSKNRMLRKKLMISDNVEIREYGSTYEECVNESRRISLKNGWYNANPGSANNIMNMQAFSYIADEICQYVGEYIDTIFCQTSQGYSVSGLHLGLKQMWVNEKIEKLPRIFAVGTSYGNAIIDSYKNGLRDIKKLDSEHPKKTKYNISMINDDCANGQGALDAIYDTDGIAIGVSDDDLINDHNRFRKIEKQIKLKVIESYPISALFKMVESGELKNGNHVLILNDAKVDLDIRVVKKKNLDISYSDFLKKIDYWMIEFSDPKNEIREALDNAFENGYVIGAYQNNMFIGIAVVSPSKYDDFFPKYHLSYIVTKKGIKGMGIATQLIQKVIEITNGNFSLHVETDNKRAIKLYEKMGLKKKYYRMLYNESI